MELICISCGNYTYFDVDAEGIKTILLTDAGIVIDDLIIEGWNHSDEALRNNLEDITSYVLKQINEVITFDSSNDRYYNSYVTCGRCGSNQVTVPCSEWHPTMQPNSIDDELIENRTEYLNLRKERYYENRLPCLWQS